MSHCGRTIPFTNHIQSFGTQKWIIIVVDHIKFAVHLKIEKFIWIFPAGSNITMESLKVGVPKERGERKAM